MALGARSRDVLALVVKEGLLLASVGVTMGLVIASWLTYVPARRAAAVDPMIALRSD